MKGDGKGGAGIHKNNKRSGKPVETGAYVGATRNKMEISKKNKKLNRKAGDDRGRMGWREGSVREGGGSW